MNKSVNPKIILVSGYARAGKDTFASNMIQPLSVAHRVSFAYELKEIANKTLWMLGLNHIDLHRDEDKVKYRDILIGIARTARAADPAIFARLACRRINEIYSAGSHVIVTDWRYANEHEYLCEKFGHTNIVTVMVEREGGVPAHEEEESSIAEILNSININVRVVAKDGDTPQIAHYANHLASAINGGAFDLPESRTLA
jgi:hypothetical protein